MASTEYALFDSAIGRCGIAWKDRVIAAIQLPEKTDDATIARLCAKAPEASAGKPPAFVKRAIAAISTHLLGRIAKLEEVPLELEALPPFHRKVAEALRQVPAGRTVTYAELAKLAGSPKASRAVGQAMAQNRFPVVVPCHRVLAAGGAPGGFSANGGIITKSRLLAIEGVRLQQQESLFDGALNLPYDPEDAVRVLSEEDPKLAALIEKIGPFRLKLSALSGPYEALANSIIYQQLNGRAAATIASRVKAAFGRDTYPPPEELLAAPDELLRGAGLSRGKLAALRDLATKARDGLIPGLSELERMDDQAIVDALTPVRGIGRWTVEMMLIFRLGRPDVLPVDDFGIRKGFGRVFLRGRHAEKAEVSKRGERWRPFRSVASWYLWRASELPE